MSKASRDKGKRGERDVINWLQPILDGICEDLGVKKVLLQRNTVQSDRGGTDIVGLNWLGAEVKNCEAQGPKALKDWWQQCVDQCEEWGTAAQPLTPVLFYTKARADIRVRMPGAVWTHHCADVHILISPVDISADDFESYFKARCRHELQPGIKSP